MKPLFVVFALFASAVAYAGTSQDLQIAVSPAKSFFLPGDFPSCRDLADHRATPNIGVHKSIKDLRLNFVSFKLTWLSDDILQVVSLSVTVENPNILNHKYEVNLEPAEIEALLGVPQARINGRKSLFEDTLSSDDPSRNDSNYVFPPCGLSVGGIEMGTKSPFTAKAVISLVGYSIAADGTQTPVKAVTEAEVEFVN